MFSRLRAVPEDRNGGLSARSFGVVALAVAFAAIAGACTNTPAEDGAEASSAPVPVQSDSAPDGDAGPRKAQSKAEAMSAVKNAATALEVWGVENGGTYTGVCGGPASTSCSAFRQSSPGADNRLVANGLAMPDAVALEVIRADDRGYCLRATHDELPRYEVYFASEEGVPSEEPCT